MSRFAGHGRVIFWEEPVHVDGLDAPDLHVEHCAATGVVIVTPHIPADAPREQDGATVKRLLGLYLAGEAGTFIRWYYTPMMLPMS